MRREDLNQSQQAAYDTILGFLNGSSTDTMILKGNAGYGKSTLVKAIVEALERQNQVKKAVDPKHVSTPIYFAASTNKAAENLSSILDKEVSTVHTLFGMRVDPIERKTVIGKSSRYISDAIIFIDEAGTIPNDVLKYIHTLTNNCKILFIGDPAQLLPIKHSKSPVFDSGFPSVELTEPIRFGANSPIDVVATTFRDVVYSKSWRDIVIDDNQVMHLSTEEFLDEIKKEFSRKDWHYNDSKILAWKNSTVISYNQYLKELITGYPEFQEGDYGISNTFVSSKIQRIRSGDLVHISKILTRDTKYDIKGTYLCINNKEILFLPDSYKEMSALISNAQKHKDIVIMSDVNQSWIDLRAAYAQTVDKSQGSTYNKVFIDLDDISKCSHGDQIARMLYVATSRAKNQVILKGDLV